MSRIAPGSPWAQIFDRKIFRSPVSYFVLIVIISIFDICRAVAGPNVSVITMNPKPPLGVVMQVGQSLKISSITELTDSTVNALSQQFATRILRPTGLEECESLACYGQRLRQLTGSESLTHVALVSIEAFDAQQDEVSILVLDIQRGKTFANLEAHQFGTTTSLAEGVSNFALKLAPQVATLFPTGTIELSIDRSSVQVMLDGALIGQTDGRNLRIEKVPAGEHLLSFSGEKINPSQLRVNVRANELHQNKIETVLREQTSLKNVVLIGGVVSSLLGASLVAWSSHLESKQPEILCLAASMAENSACGTGDRFLRFGSDASSINPNDGSVAIAPLGYSLALAGTSLVGGGIWANDEDDLQLWVVSSGIVLGLITYGLSISQEGKSGFDVP